MLTEFLPLQSPASKPLASEQSFNSLHERLVGTYSARTYSKNFAGALNAALILAYIKAQNQGLCTNNKAEVLSEECLMFVLDEYHKKMNEFFESVTQKSNE